MHRGEKGRGGFSRGEADPETEWKKMARRHPMGRIGTTKEIADACLYLASDRSAFMTGQLIVLDGGMTI